MTDAERADLRFIPGRLYPVESPGVIEFVSGIPVGLNSSLLLTPPEGPDLKIIDEEFPKMVDEGFPSPGEGSWR